MKEMQKAVLASAVPAQATVLSLTRGDFTTGGAFRRLELKLKLLVQPASDAPYEATTQWLVDEIALPRVQPQQVVSVKINSEHPERVYPAEEWAEFSDWLIKTN